MLIFTHSGSLPRRFQFPRPTAIASLPWRLFVDTNPSAQSDIYPGGTGPLADTGQPFELAEHSLVCFVAESEPDPVHKGIALKPG